MALILMQEYSITLVLSFLHMQVNYINERGILLTIEKVKRDLTSCAKRLNRALRDLEKAMDERPDIQRFDGDGGLTAVLKNSSGLILLREEICRVIE